MTEPLGTIYVSKKTLVATPGSQRRCYHGCFHPNDWEEGWTEWDWLNLNVPESKLEFWNNLGCEGDPVRSRYKWEPNK